MFRQTLDCLSQVQIEDRLIEAKRHEERCPTLMQQQMWSQIVLFQVLNGRLNGSHNLCFQDSLKSKILQFASQLCRTARGCIAQEQAGLVTALQSEQ